MTFRTPSPARARVLLPVALTLAVLLVVVLVGTGVYTDLLFYRSIGFSSVFTTVLWTRILLFVLAALVVSVFACGNAVVAYRTRPPFRPVSAEQQNLDRYRIAIEPRLGLLLVVLGALLALAAGSAAQAHWQTWLQWRNGTPFGVRDPQFGRDVAYYAFTYPMQRLVLGLLFEAVLLSIMVTASVSYLFGGIRLQTPGDKMVPAAKAHLSVLLGLLVLLKAAAYYLDRFGLNFSTRGFVDTGASYTDVKVVLPAKTILLIISIVCALLFFANVRLRGWRLPTISLGLLVFAAVVVGGLVPAIYQRFSVKPNELVRESPYIEANITATRAAYGLAANTTQMPYGGGDPVPGAQVRSDPTLSNLRLLDPNLLGPTFEQLQQLKNYYGFVTSLDIDRYRQSDGGLQDFVVAAREVNLAGLDPGQRNWINEHLVYTHGQGFVAAPTDRVDNRGQPEFSTSGLPVTGDLQIAQSRIYFGEQSPAYSVVRTRQQEVDGLDARNSYDGKGGVGIGSTFRRLAFALQFRDANLLLSSALNSQSAILYNRTPRERVEKVAPWLKVDTDPYPAVIGGRIVWILDGYTTSNGYPYSARTSLEDATSDSENTGTRATRAQQVAEQINYIRNSVKAVVDAGDGTVQLYQWDDADPVLRTWMKAFPNKVIPKPDIPPELVDHFRYPEDLFKVQRELLTRYHVTDPQVFYGGEDFWTVPPDPTAEGAAKQPPYYVLSQVPGQTTPQFNLTTTFSALRRPNMTAVLSVSSGGSTVTSQGSRYGDITLLRLRSEAFGVTQAQQRLNTFQAFSRDQALFNQGNTRLQSGNLLTLPVGNSLFYLEPVYLSGSATSFPVLSKVLALYGNTVAYENTAAAALDAALTATPATPPVGTGTGTEPPTAAPTPSPTGASPSPSVGPSSPAPLPSDAAAALRELQALQQQQQQTNDRINRLLQQLLSSQVATQGPAPPTPAASGTPSPGPSP